MAITLKQQQKLLRNVFSQKVKHFRKKNQEQIESCDDLSFSSSNSLSSEPSSDVERDFLPAKNKYIKKTSHKKFNLKTKVIAEGHRGVGIHLVENTLKCFQRGIEIGLDSIELDVWLTSDKQLVIVHGKDDDTIKLDDGTYKKVNEMTYQEIIQNYTLAQGEKCPLLVDVLQICKDKIHLNIEIKGRENEMCEHLLDLVIQCGMLNQVHFSSFLHYHQNLLVKALEQRGLPTNIVQFGYLIYEHKDLNDFESYQFQNNILAFPAGFVYDEYTLPFIFKAKERGMKLSTYFDFDVIENYNIYNRLYQIGVDCIITNQPQLLNSFIKKFFQQ